MNNIIIIHGAYGNPEENWFPWLKEKLEELDYNVFIPKFPTPENQSLKNWLRIFEDYEEYLNKDSIIIGHSLGVAFLLNVLEGLNKPLKAAFFISGFVNLLGDPNFDEINKSFIEREFDWDKIKRNCPSFSIIHSDNDPYVPTKEADNLAKNLGTSVAIIKKAGHFNKDAGYVNFNFLFDEIKSIL